MQTTGAATARWALGWSRSVTEPSSPGAPAVSVADLESADDQTIVAAFVGGRREAFDVIVTRHRKAVYQLCYRFTGNHEDASDLAQDVFVRAFKGLGKFKGDSALGTWLHRIGVNAALNRAAVRKPVTEPFDAVERVDGTWRDPVAVMAEGADRARVRAAIRRLPPKQQATLILRVYHERSHEEIARTLGTSVGAAKANFFHALGNLKRLIQS